MSIAAFASRCSKNCSSAENSEKMFQKNQATASVQLQEQKLQTHTPIYKHKPVEYIEVV